MLNFARFMVGIPNEVTNDSSYEKLAQDASLLMKVNNIKWKEKDEYSHFIIN